MLRPRCSQRRFNRLWVIQFQRFLTLKTENMQINIGNTFVLTDKLDNQQVNCSLSRGVKFPSMTRLWTDFSWLACRGSSSRGASTFSVLEAFRKRCFRLSKMSPPLKAESICLLWYSSPPKFDCSREKDKSRVFEVNQGSFAWEHDEVLWSRLLWLTRKNQCLLRTRHVWLQNL